MSKLSEVLAALDAEIAAREEGVVNLMAARDLLARDIAEAPPATERRPARAAGKTCSACGKAGHNKRSCKAGS